MPASCVQETVFGVEWDCVLRKGLVNRKTVEEIMEMNPMKDALDTIYEMFNDENKKDEDKPALPSAGGCAPPACDAIDDVHGGSGGGDDMDANNRLLQELLTASHVNVDLRKRRCRSGTSCRSSRTRPRAWC